MEEQTMSRRPRTTLMMALAVLAAGPTVAPPAAHAAPPRYGCTILPGTFEAYGVNKLSEVVGAMPLGHTSGAFYYKAGRLTSFGQEDTWASAISDAGRIAGVHEGRAMMADRAGNITVMEDGGAEWSEAWGINDANQAVGYTENN